MVDRVWQCIAEGFLKEDSAEEIAMLLLSTCNGFFSLHVSKKVTASLEEMAHQYDRMYQRLLSGLLI